MDKKKTDKLQNERGALSDELGMSEIDEADVDHLADLFLKMQNELEETREKTYHEKVLNEKKYTYKADQFYQQGSLDDSVTRKGAAVAAALTDANFEDEIAHKIWSRLPDKKKNGMLVDFKCSRCLIQDILGISIDEQNRMSEKQLRKTMEKAVRLQNGENGTPTDDRAGIVQLEDIRIHFGRSDFYEGQEDFLQITGNCERCGSAITRTMGGTAMRMLNGMGNLMRRVEECKPGKVGRNDPCPCGSGLKYKKCCGKNA